MCVNHVACREEGQEVEVKVPITTAHSITTCVCSVACGKGGRVRRKVRRTVGI